MSRKTHSISLVVAGTSKLQQPIPINAYGKFHIRLGSIWYLADDVNHEKVIEIRGRQFQLKYASGNRQFTGGKLTSDLVANQYPVFIYSKDHQIGGLNGMYQWDMELEGQIECELYSILGDDVANNDTCVLNLELTPIEAGGSQ